MELLIPLLIILAVISIVYVVMANIPLPQPVRIAAVVIFGLIAIIMLLSLMPGGHGIWLR